MIQFEDAIAQVGLLTVTMPKPLKRGKCSFDDAFASILVNEMALISSQSKL